MADSVNGGGSRLREGWVAARLCGERRPSRRPAAALVERPRGYPGGGDGIEERELVSARRPVAKSTASIGSTPASRPPSILMKLATKLGADGFGCSVEVPVGVVEPR